MNMEQVAVIYGNRISEDSIIQPLVMLGEYYNGAFVCIESNSMGKHTCVEMGKRYPVERLYHRDDHDKTKTRMSREIGWRTTFSNKSIMIGSLSAAMTQNQIVLRCKETVKECRTYVNLRGGGTGADAGFHDDHVIALALAVMAAKSYPTRLESFSTSMPNRNLMSWSKMRRRDEAGRCSQTGY